MTSLRSLYRTLSSRATPEDIADAIVTLPGFTEADRSHFPAQPRWHPWFKSSMRKDWFRPAVPRRTLDTLATLLDLPKADPEDPISVRALLAKARTVVSMTEGDRNFKRDRLNRDARRFAGLGSMSRRRYDKLFRIVGRLDKEVNDLDAQAQLADLAVFAKIGLATQVPYRNFSASPNTAAFVAFYAANLARRSLFTNGPQASALDTASTWLLSRCETDPATDWFAIAHVFPRDDVMGRLTPDQRGDLVAKALDMLSTTAGLLGKAVTPDMNLDTMVVGRGDDSSTWNAVAGAWNKARDLWLSTTWALDPSISDAFLPGKVLRLMAADVAAWHRATGGDIHPDTKVWAALPRPWAVFDGSASCTRRDVIAACESVGVNPATSGWAKPRPRTKVDISRPTPETVHGVVVAHPQLAEILRRAGWFSGHGGRPYREIGVSVEVTRDEYGFAVEAR